MLRRYMVFYRVVLIGEVMKPQVRDNARSSEVNFNHASELLRNLFSFATSFRDSERIKKLLQNWLFCSSFLCSRTVLCCPYEAKARACLFIPVRSEVSLVGTSRSLGRIRGAAAVRPARSKGVPFDLSYRM